MIKSVSTKIGILVLLLLTACDDPLVGSFEDTSPDGKLIYTLNIQSGDIDRLSELQAEFTVTNRSADSLSYTFSSGCQHGYTIRHNGDLLLDSRSAFACTAALSHLNLGPGESRSYPIDLSRIEALDHYTSGRYTLEAFLLLEDAGEVTGRFAIE